MHDFVALDIETANDNRYSICSIGLVKFKDGDAIDTYYSLIDPEEEFDYFNVMIHGITEVDIVDSPTFPEIRDEILSFIASRPVVAHFAQFDIGAFKDNYDRYGLEYDEINYACSYFLAKALNKGFINYKLNTLSKHYGIELKHHDALSDANASGQLINQLIKENNIKFLDELREVADYPSYGTLGKKRFHRRNQRGPQHPTNFDRELTEEEILNLNENHPFYELNFVVSGNFNGHTQNDIKEKILLAGGIPQKGSVTKKTNVLVCGEQDLRVVGESGMSSKMKKAHSLKEAGQDIEIITEDDFFQITNSY